MVLTAYIVLSPATNSSCHRRQRISGLSKTRLGLKNLRQLDTSNGCQDHTVLPYTLASFVLRAAWVAHGRPALRLQSRPTLPRPPHPVPTFVTMANAPLRDGMAGFLEVIWGDGEAEYFLGRDWTAQISLKLLRKIAQSRTTDRPPAGRPSGAIDCNGVASRRTGRELNALSP